MHKRLGQFVGWQPQLEQQHQDGEGAGGDAGAGGGAAGGDAAAAAAAADAAAQAAAASAAGGAGGDNKGGAGDGTPKMFTQEQLEYELGQRLKRAKSEPPADYAELQDKAKKFDDLELANKTELEQERIKREAAEQLAAAATVKTNETLRRAAVMAEASKAKAADVEAVFVVLNGTKKYADMVTIDNDGEVTGVEEAVKALLTDKPYLVGTTSAGSADGGARGEGAAEPETLEDAVFAELKKQSG